MTSYSQAQRQNHAESQAELSDVFHSPTPHVAMQARDAARSEQNIAEWLSYLPADCVKTMISMGWNVST